MSKSTDEVIATGKKKLGIKANKNNKKKENNMKRINLETVKTVTIFVLVTAIIAFVAGMKYQKNYEKAVEVKAHALASQQAAIKTEASKQ